MYLFGASGHGKVVKEIIEQSGKTISGFIDDNSLLDEFFGKKVFHEFHKIDSLIVSIGDNQIRAQVVSRMDCPFGVAIHPNAIISPSATIGEGSVVMAGSIINSGAVIGKHCIVNTGASVDHDCVVSDFCHVAPHATLCGGVYLGVGVMVGAGACILPGIKIGDWGCLGAGGVAISDVPDGATMVGVPAKQL